MEYKKNGDYLIPDIQLDEQSYDILKKYGSMRKTYLKEHKSGMYTALVLSNKLMEHLISIQDEAENRIEKLMEQMKQNEGVTEQLKIDNQMLWVQKMYSIQNRAEEIVLEEIIYI